MKLSPEAYQAIRRNPADFNQTLRDFVVLQLGDNPSAMSNTISAEGIHGLEGVTLIPTTTPLSAPIPNTASVKLDVVRKP